MSKSSSGVRRFTSLDLARIADLCGVSVDWLPGVAQPTPRHLGPHRRGSRHPIRRHRPSAPALREPSSPPHESRGRSPRVPPNQAQL
ncbi:hypothetical protein [Nonomuraea salmonea]|uniref:hypothetical protein n=1 Tax=Nonomuraea salmonea TaxID=46181 RepID=UPI0031E5FE8F